jgi:hypothetical protein
MTRRVLTPAAPYAALVLRVTLGLMFWAHLYWEIRTRTGRRSCVVVGSVCGQSLEGTVTCRRWRVASGLRYCALAFVLDAAARSASTSPLDGVRKCPSY